MAKVYGIRDVKAACFRSFFACSSEAEAIRNLAVAVCDGQSQLNLFASDYDLYHMCDIDEDAGSITKPEQPVFVVNAGSVKAQYQQLLHIPEVPEKKEEENA